jgi:hypothetical protein
MEMSDLRNLNGKDVAQGVNSPDSGGTLITGAGIDFYRLLSIRQALRLQEHGIKLSRSVPMGTTLARRMLGLKGNRVSLLSQVDAIIARIQSERAIAEGGNIVDTIQDGK